MKHSILALYLLVITFMWEPPITGNPADMYTVDVSDRLGQIVESAVVSGNIYRVQQEGTLRLSVAGIDMNGNIGPYSEWSEPQITPDERIYLVTFGTRTNMSLLFFVGEYVNTINELWVDPHIVEEE